MHYLKKKEKSTQQKKTNERKGQWFNMLPHVQMHYGALCELIYSSACQALYQIALINDDLFYREKEINNMTLK